MEEVLRADADVRRFIAEQFTILLQTRDVDHLLDGNIRGPEGRVDIVRARLAAMSDMGSA